MRTSKMIAALSALIFGFASPRAAEAAETSKKGATQMEIKRKAELQTVEGPATYFTGRATITGQFQRPEPSRVGGAIVHFEPGARPAWRGRVEVSGRRAG